MASHLGSLWHGIVTVHQRSSVFLLDLFGSFVLSTEVSEHLDRLVQVWEEPWTWVLVLCAVGMLVRDPSEQP